MQILKAVLQYRYRILHLNLFYILEQDKDTMIYDHLIAPRLQIRQSLQVNLHTD